MFKRILASVLALTFLFCLIPDFTITTDAATGYDRGYKGGMAGDEKIVAHGLDVSAWQESGLNFQNFVNAGYDYVILRCGTSVKKDICFEEFYRNAKAVGLDVGCYFYSYATTVAQARQEAYDVLEYIKGKKFEYPVYFDFEDPTQIDLDYTLSGQICRGFMDVLKDNGYLVGLYSMSWMLNRSWVTSSGINGLYEGWVAHVYSDAPNTGITSNEYNIYKDRYCSTYGMHQYSFTTYVNGVGSFDANVCYKDYPAIVKKYGFNGYQDQETWVEKAAFDVMVYRDRNPDLKDMTDAQLKEHWLKNGIKEGRASSTVLDLGFYLNNNTDLKEAFGTDYEKAYNHFITKGYKEGRKSSALFDGSYYCEKYPEVKESFKDDYMRHYIENGMKEGRRASLTFDPDYYWFIRPDVYNAWPDDYTMCARHYAGHGIVAQVEAYDNKHPVISNVKISDVTAAGYTVTCEVTDNWGLSKVAFPTWTLLNNQDDLAADFMNTQKGTKNGNTYTFRVNASDHNYETGEYVTHIYALDKGGNQTKLSLEVVDVKDPVVEPPVVEPVVEEIKLTSSASYSADSTYVKKVKASTTVSSLLSQFDNDNLKVFDKNGKALSNTSLVGTGATVKLYDGTKLVDSLTVIVAGDVDGNAVVDTTDYMRVKQTFLRSFTLNAVEIEAADVEDNDIVDSTDCMRIKSHFLGAYNLFA